MPSQTRSLERRVVNAAALAGAGILLFFMLVWLVDLEQRLPEVRAPREFSNSEALPGHAIMAPGFHEIDQIDTELSGEWLEQEIGDSTWLASDAPGSRMRAVFYGTDVYLIARIGPEAGQAYVRVDGDTVEHLNEDEMGTYSNLWAGEASNQPVLLASSLAHGEHVVEITAGGEGEVAISGFDVVAETPFQWAFMLAYAGIGGGIFVVIRLLLLGVTRPGAKQVAARTYDQPDADVSTR